MHHRQPADASGPISSGVWLNGRLARFWICVWKGADQKTDHFWLSFASAHQPGCLILDFELTPANTGDLEAGFELLSQHTDLEVLGDKAYISSPKSAELWAQNRIRLRILAMQQSENPGFERVSSLSQRHSPTH